jgi:predicted HicB family RNase H-like nuclease
MEMTMFEAKDYLYEATWSDDDEAYVCRVIDFPGILAHGDTIPEAVREAQVAVEGALEALAAKKTDAPVPLSKRNANGKVLVRMTRELHSQLLEDAARDGVSLNALITQRLARATGAAIFSEIERIARADDAAREPGTLARRGNAREDLDEDEDERAAKRRAKKRSDARK